MSSSILYYINLFELLICARVFFLLFCLLIICLLLSFIFSPENGLTSSRNALGGTWQHRQVADSISLSSHCTDDEDDRTTFTDDDSTVYRPSLDLSEFDPLLETPNINASLSNPLCNENSISDNWLLSALQSCSNQIAEKDVESILEFPAPFDEVEYGEIATPSNEYPLTPNAGIRSFFFALKY